jgi:hypothetical protein
MITVSLMGGLGNQMFQYAAGKALAQRHGVALALDVSGFKQDVLRSYLLDRLNVPEAQPTVALETAEKVENKFGRAKWKGRINRLLGRAHLPKLVEASDEYREPHLHYDPAFETLGPNTSMFGYFQSERYFGSIANSLSTWLAPREALDSAAGETLARIQRSQLPVSNHGRRGDYLNPGTTEFHGVLGEPYYREAVSRIEASVGAGADFFVFSDDPVAAEQLLTFVPGSRLNHVRGDPDRPWEDILLMASCRHHVIANSSFSWWGAWLNRSSEKCVIAPRGWFAPAQLAKLNTHDLLPSEWIRI